MLRDWTEVAWHVGVVVLAAHWAWRKPPIRLTVVVVAVIGLVYHVAVKWLCYANHGCI